MPMIGGSIPVGATFSPTGGTARTLSSLGGDRSGVKLLVEDSAAFSLRTTINVTATEGTPNSGYPGGMTPNKRRVATVVPILLADGSYFNNQVINELIVHPETSDAQIAALRSLGVNTYNDADFDGLWKQGSKS
jgi:hypothetical protein